MCGIVGLFLKDKSLEPQLGALLSEMLVSMTDRGPDSAGIAIYGAGDGKRSKITVQSADARARFRRPRRGARRKARRRRVADRQVDPCRHRGARGKARRGPRGACRAAARTSASWAPARASRSTRKSACRRDVVERFDLRQMTGTHGIGHTRMATESAVTTLGAHPFSTGPDQCLVHNGSLSNHNNCAAS